MITNSAELPTVRLAVPEPWFKELKGDLNKRFQELRAPLHLLSYPLHLSLPKTDLAWDWGTWQKLLRQKKLAPAEMGLVCRFEVPDLSPTDESPLLQPWYRRMKRQREAWEQRQGQEAWSQLFEMAMRRFLLDHLRKEARGGQEKLRTDMSSNLAVYILGLHRLIEQNLQQLDSVTQLDGVMKGLWKILIVDGLEAATVQELGAYGYDPSSIKTLAPAELQKLRVQHQASVPPERREKLRPMDFLLEVPELVEYDLICINHWKAEEERMPVLLTTNRKLALSREEEERLNQSERFLQRVAEKKERLEKLNQQIEELGRQLSSMETVSHTEVDRSHENQYQRLQQIRRRMLAQQKKLEAEIRNLSKPVKQKRQTSVRNCDLYEQFPESGGLLGWAGQLVGSKDGEEAAGKAASIKRAEAKAKLQQMAEVSRQLVRVEHTLQQQLQQMNLLTQQLEELMFVEKGKNPPWQDAFREHLVDWLEVQCVEQLLAKCMR